MSFAARKIDPLELELNFPGLHIPQPRNQVLHYLPVLPDDGALVGEAVVAAWLDPPYGGRAREVLNAHLYALQVWPDVDLGLSHCVVSRERIFVVNCLHDSVKNTVSSPIRETCNALNDMLLPILVRAAGPINPDLPVDL